MAAYESDIDFEWKYQTGDVVTFNTVQSDLMHLNGSIATVCGRLDSSEADLNETGPMYLIAIGEQALDAFEDELNPVENN